MSSTLVDCDTAGLAPWSVHSEQLGLDFAEQRFHIFEKEFNQGLSQTEVHKLRIIRMIGDFQLHGAILRRYYKHKDILAEPSFICVACPRL